ncbi:MAG: 1-aminocyclopropane-1-carboxylate deaminase/D-cysteine desulfhydrase [Bacteroidia bacterium]
MYLSLGLPSRIDQICFTFRGIPIQLAVKRDDLIHPLINGNKWRKLSHYLNRATEAGKNKLISVGGAYSNHLLAMATLAKLHKFEAICYLRGNEERSKNTYEHWLMQLGARLHYVNREIYRNKEQLYSILQSQYPEALLIPEGGYPLPEHHAPAALLDEQDLSDFSHLMLSCGTGAMLLALAKGLRDRNSNIHLHGISAIANFSFIHEINQQVAAIYPFAQLHPKPVKSRFGKLHPDMFEITQACFHQTGILADPIYDSALLLHVYQGIQNESLPNNGNLLWLHSGGQTGWAGFTSKLDEL